MKGKGNRPDGEAPRQREIWLCNFDDDAFSSELSARNAVIVVSSRRKKKRNKTITIVPLFKKQSDRHPAVSPPLPQVDGVVSPDGLNECKPFLRSQMWANVELVSCVSRSKMRRITRRDATGVGKGHYREKVGYKDWVELQGALARWLALGYLTASNDFDM